MGSAAIWAQRKELLARDIELDPHVFVQGLRTQEIILAADLGLEKTLRAVEQCFLKIECDTRGEILALGIGNLTAFDNCQNVALADGVSKPFAQFRDGAEQSHGDLGDVFAAGNDRARHGNAFAQCPRGRLPDREVSGSDLAFAELHAGFFMLLGFALRRWSFVRVRGGEKNARECAKSAACDT